jgi:predicted nucleotidyltransferase
MRLATERRFPRLNELQEKLQCKWPSIQSAMAETDRELATLEKSLLPEDGRPLVEDASLVFFGSLARGESTSQSDLDWILLIDGAVDAQHFRTFKTIQKRIADAKKPGPGTTGTFGDLAFANELVHRIGGQDDTNINFTRRMLLLLESVSIGGDEVRKRVIRAILNRYLADDPSWTWDPDKRLPRFLLNDVIRFWRTMTVDFADKYHDQAGEKWALRNAKLRFSRRLILMTGLLACFNWKLNPPNGLSEGEKKSTEVAIAHFEAYLGRPPLEILAEELLRAGAPNDLCRSVFSAYDEFLGILDDERSRNELKEIPREAAHNSPTFQRVRAVSHQFRDALLSWLYSPNTPLCELVKQYALF